VTASASERERVVRSRSPLLWYIGAAVCFLAAALLAWNAGLPERAAFTGRVMPGELPVAPEIGAVAPPFTATSIDETRVSLSDLRGHPVLVNFWATWCVPCRVEMPMLEEVYRDTHAKGLRILAVNLGEDPQTAREWGRGLGLTFDLLSDPRGDIAAVYALRGQPSTYVISPSGIITAIFYGPASGDALRSALAPYLSD
jgi:cytochrome c biogenesis protein CcmG/thiol:disulfide interchange protein DsbE